MNSDRILGPLEVRASDGPVPLGGAKQRALLALLLLNANRVVSRERLIDELWGDEPPETAVTTVQVYVSRLRKLLPARGAADAAAGLPARGRAGRARPVAVRAAASRRRAQRGPPSARRGCCARRSSSGAGRALAEFDDEPFAQVESGAARGAAAGGAGGADRGRPGARPPRAS